MLLFILYENFQICTWSTWLTSQLNYQKVLLIKKSTWLVWLTLFFPTVVVLVLHGCLEGMELLLLLMLMGTCTCMKRQALNSYISPCCVFWFEHVFTLIFFLFFFFPRAKMAQMILHSLLSKIQCSFLLRMHVTVRCWNR